MATEKRLIDANALREVMKNEECNCEVFPWAVDNAPTVDAVPVDEVRFLSLTIDKSGVPELVLQLGERTLILRTDPVDAVEVVRCGQCQFCDTVNAL